jgi:hypothetical protein
LSGLSIRELTGDTIRELMGEIDIWELTGDAEMV